MNKGLKLRLCPECKKKRFCKREPIPGHNYKITCSQGHIWTIQGITAERVSLAMEEHFSKETVSSLFDRDDTFYSVLRKR